MTQNGVAAWTDVDGDGIATATLNSGGGGGGTPDDNSVTTAKIADGSILDADINAAAAIALSKLATNPLARANHTGTQTLSTISDAGTLAGLSAVASAQITDGTIVGGDLSSTIAIPSAATATTQSAADSSTKVATTAFVTTADNLKANLAGPTFTGTVTLPSTTVAVTPSASDNSTKPATTAYVDTADALKANIASPTLTGTPTLPTGTIVTTQAATDSSTAVASTAYVMAKEWAFILGKAGAIGATETDASDFFFIVPFNCTMLRMKAVVKSAATGAMTVQLRAATTPSNSISWANVSGFVCTYTGSGYFTASIDPANVNASEGDLLGFSCATGSGSDLMVQVVVTHR